MTRQARIAAPMPLSSSGPASSHDQPPSSEAVRGRADEDLARHRRLLEPRREVHGFARRERRVRLVDDDLAGLDADAHFEIQLADGVAHPERRPRGALGVVLVRLRDAERGEHGVARELLDDAAVHRRRSGTRGRRTRPPGGGRPPDRRP